MTRSRVAPGLRSVAVAAVVAIGTEALGCPQCAGRDTYGVGFALLLLSMIALPFSIVALVVRVIRKIERSRPAPSMATLSGMAPVREIHDHTTLTRTSR